MTRSVPAPRSRSNVYMYSSMFTYLSTYWYACIMTTSEISRHSDTDHGTARRTSDLCSLSLRPHLVHTQVAQPQPDFKATPILPQSTHEFTPRLSPVFIQSSDCRRQSSRVALRLARWVQSEHTGECERCPLQPTVILDASQWCLMSHAIRLTVGPPAKANSTT